jgi:hypothetical protein
MAVVKRTKNDPKVFVHSRGWLRDRIIIHRQDGPGGIHPVFVELNNFPVLIPREVECEVAKPLVQTLREAIATNTYRDEKGELYTRDIQKYNFTVLEENVNWDEIMNNEEFFPMNKTYLLAIGKWTERQAEPEENTKQAATA